jgi:hypothetical protein
MTGQEAELKAEKYRKKRTLKWLKNWGTIYMRVHMVVNLSKSQDELIPEKTLT